ncbi:unnamed protein product [Cylicostephanus goldi]|uniref:Uncharacterized protein n=1 Tax=Cylicostephanus goldi TaxID=71465 RepID=A0A3P7Q5V7_CYLGO|nr:unnamed protein product [Cylicostephanus goldi]
MGVIPLVSVTAFWLFIGAGGPFLVRRGPNQGLEIFYFYEVTFGVFSQMVSHYFLFCFRNHSNHDYNDGCMLLANVDHGTIFHTVEKGLILSLQIYLHQLNPLIGPQINVRTALWISEKWGDSNNSIPEQ